MAEPMLVLAGVWVAVACLGAIAVTLYDLWRRGR